MPRSRPGRPGLQVVALPGRAALYLRGTVGGRRIFQSAGTADRGLAEEARATLEARLYREALHGAPAARRTFAEALIGYTRDRQPTPRTRRQLARALRALGPDSWCDAIDQARIDTVADRLLRPGYLPATKLREVVTPIRAVLQWAALRGWCAAPLFERGAPSRRRTEWLTPAEAEALLAAAAPALRPLLLFLLGTGARLGEALSLQWHSVDLAQATAVLRETKNGHDRVVTLRPRLIAALAAIEGRTGVVFRHRRGAYAERLLYGGHIRTAWRTAVARAGITHHVTPHALRHTWATWHYAEHRDLLLLRRDGDWSSVALVERYAHLAPSTLAPEIAAFWHRIAVVRRAS